MVGRRPSCDIRLDYANVSSHHCRLEYINGFWRAADISTNGTKVNGERIDEKFLQPGDTVSFARHAFEIQYTPDPDAVAPTDDVDPFALSLLEKAGLAHLERRDRNGEYGRSGAGVKPNPQKGSGPQPGNPPTQLPVNPPSDDEEQALEWLND